MSSGFEVGQRVGNTADPKATGVIKFIKDGEIYVKWNHSCCLWEHDASYLRSLEPIPEEPAAPVLNLKDEVEIVGPDFSGHDRYRGRGIVVGFDDDGDYVVWSLASKDWSVFRPGALKIIPQEQKPDLYEWPKEFGQGVILDVEAACNAFKWPYPYHEARAKDLTAWLWKMLELKRRSGQ